MMQHFKVKIIIKLTYSFEAGEFWMQKFCDTRTYTVVHVIFA